MSCLTHAAASPHARHAAPSAGPGRPRGIARFAGRPGCGAKLTAAREHELATAIASGDADARRELIESNAGLVVTIARHFAGRGLEHDDLVGEGQLGLIHAADQFDPAFGVRFSTYAGYWIREAILSALTTRGTAVRVPSHMAQLLRRWRDAEAGLGRESGSAPSFEEVAERLGLSASHRVMAADALRTRRPSMPMGATGMGGEEPAAPEAGPAAAAERADEVRGLWARMAARLDERERRVLDLRYGLSSGEPMTLKQVGAALGLTREWARKLERRAVARLGD